MESVTESPRVYILKILLKNLPDVDVKSDNCEEFFNLITHLMKLCQASFKQSQATSSSIIDEHQSEGIQMTETMSTNTLKQRFFLEDGSFSSFTLLQWCIYQLKMRPTYEDRYSQYTDKVLAGYLQLTQTLLDKNPALKELTVQGAKGFNLVKTIFDFLFLLPSMEDQKSKHRGQHSANASDQNPKCKRKLTRKKAFNLLLTLC